MSRSDFPIGATVGGLPFTLNLDALIGSHACIVANSGGGKSGLIRRTLEVTHGHVQQIVLDIEDEFYTLREAGDYVIAGGADGDCPATELNAGNLARAALDANFSLIVQMNDLGIDGARRFVDGFLSALMSAPRDQWRPLLIVIDEAHRFAPSDGRTEASQTIRALTGQGRKRGFTALLASQRIAKIDPDVRGDINNWMLGRVGQALDRKTVADVLGFSPSSMEARDLQRMPPRTFWGFGPALAVMPECFAVDDVVTTPVRAGQMKVPTPPAPEALREVLAALSKPVAEYVTDADEAREADHTIALAVGQQQLDDLANQLATMERRALTAEQTLANYTVAWNNVGQSLSELNESFGMVSAMNFAAVQHVEANDWKKSQPEQDPVTSAHAPALDAGQRGGAGCPPVTAPPLEPPCGGLNGAAMAYVSLLDRINPAKVTWQQAAAMLGKKASGGSFNTTRKALRASGQIVEEGEFIRSANPQPEGMSRAEAIELWKGVLGTVAARMIDALDTSEQAGDYLTKEGIGHAIGAQPRGGSFNSGFAALRRNGLLYEYGSGSLRLAKPLPGESS